MSHVDVPPGTPVRLSGTAFERGRQQAEHCPAQVDHVRAAVEFRMKETRAALSQPGVRGYLEDLRGWAVENDPDIMEEIAGIGVGFGIERNRLFDYLNLSLVADLDPGWKEAEECTAWAMSHPELGSIVAKNRDYRSEHTAIQRVFHHRDPAWCGRESICVGSLGSPGTFSSGFNSDGFAVADTASTTTSHGIGRHRYFLLTGLLVRCATVAEALADIASVPHAGGGMLVMGDALGTVATVELGHKAAAIEIRNSGWIARTNHFVTDRMGPLNRCDGAAAGKIRNSRRRLSSLRKLLGAAEGPLDLAPAAEIMSYHGEDGGEAFCRHGDKDVSETISGHIYATALGRMWFADGNPCAKSWREFSFDA